jgi:hypothetical protein
MGGGLYPPCTSMLTVLACSELPLGTGTTTAPPPPNHSADFFLAPTFVQTLAAALDVDTFFGPIMRGAAAALGQPVDRHGAPIVATAHTPKGGTFLVCCGCLYRRGQGEVDRLCIPAGGRLRAQVLRECHDCPLGGHFGRAKTGSLIRPLAFWVGQDLDVAEYVRTCQTCQRTKVEHGCPRGLHPLPLPSRQGRMIGVDWIAGLPTTAGGFDMIQNHVNLLSGKVHAFSTRATATADAAEIIRDMCLRSGDGFPDVLVVDHDPKFTSNVFRAFVRSMGLCLIVGSAYHKNTNAKVERAKPHWPHAARLRQWLEPGEAAVGGRTELRTQLVDPVGSSTRRRGTWRWCSRASRTGRGASAAITGASTPSREVEPLPHIDALLDGTRCCASSPSSISLLVTTSCGCKPRTGGNELPVSAVPIRVECGAVWTTMGLLLMLVVSQALTVGLDFLEGQAAIMAFVASGGLSAHPWQGPWGVRPAGRCALVYMDDCLVHSPTLEQHLLDVAEVLEILHRRKLYAKRFECEFGRQELSFLGHCLSKEGVSVDPHEVHCRLSSGRHRRRAARRDASRGWPTTTAGSWRATPSSRCC